MYYYIFGVAAVYFVLKNFFADNVELHVAMEKTKNYKKSSGEEYLSCTRMTSHDKIIKPFVITGRSNTTPERNIFFHETTCSEESSIFTCSEACAVESAALANPNSSVHLLFVSPSPPSDRSSQLLRQLQLGYENVNIGRIDLDEYFRNTHIKFWLDNELFRTSPQPEADVANILGMLSLWKFGGIQLDLDSIVTNSLENLTDFFVANNSKTVTTAIIGLNSPGVGHEIAGNFLLNYAYVYDSKFWKISESEWLSKFLRRTCKVASINHITPERCMGIRVLNPSSFLPIDKTRLKRYSNSKNIKKAMEFISKSRGIYNCTRLIGYKIHNLLTKKYCPLIYKFCNASF